MSSIERFSFPSSDRKTALAAYRRSPEGQPRAMLQISHGMCEYFLRYTEMAAYFAREGFVVFGHDHLGHGHSAATPEDLGFIASKGGADCLVEDVHALSLHMKEQHPDLPLILFGHSMGSFVAREVLARYGADYAAAVICGTAGPHTPTGAGKLLASLLILFCGERHRSRLLKSISFAGYNKKFEKGCDPNAWLSRDEALLHRYAEDPFCNYVFTLRAYRDLFTLLGRVSKKDWAARLPKDLPMLITGGEEDPVGGWGEGMRVVYERMRAAGCTRTELCLYPQLRHEIHNEPEKETVWKELVAWMTQALHSSV